MSLSQLVSVQCPFSLSSVSGAQMVSAFSALFVIPASVAEVVLFLLLFRELVAPLSP